MNGSGVSQLRDGVQSIVVDAVRVALDAPAEIDAVHSVVLPVPLLCKRLGVSLRARVERERVGGEGAASAENERC